MSAKTKVLDFSGVEDKSNFRPRRKPEGDYYAKITAVDDHQSAENTGWVFTIKVYGDSRATYPYYCMFADNQLWKIRGLVAAVGMKAPGSKVKIDPTKFVGKDIGIALADDEYEGRVKSNVDMVFPVDDLEDARNERGSASSTKAKSRKADEEEDEDDEDDEPAPRRTSAKSSKNRAPEPDDEDEDEDDDEEERPAKKSKSKKAPAKSKSKRDEDDDEDDDDEDAEDEKPKRGKKAAPAKSKKKSRDDDDEDDELDLDDL